MTTRPHNVTFRSGLPGFPASREFALVAFGGDTTSPYRDLVCTDTADLAFTVIDPAVVFPEYRPVLNDEIDSEYRDAIDLRSTDEALVLAIVTAGATPEEATVNLRGPVIINLRNREAVQACLSPRYDFKTRLVSA